jgi:hypothetical protein
MRYVIILLMGAFFCFSCHKKDTPPASTGNSGNGPVNGSVYGSLETLLVQSYFGQTYGGTDSIPVASFLGGSGTTGVNAGTVTFNNTVLKYDAIQHNYLDTSHMANIHGVCTWNVSGSANVPAITYSFNPVYPVFSGNAQLPDSVSRSAGFTVNVAGATNIANSSVIVELFAGGNSVTKQIPPNQTSCTFSHSDLAGLQNDPNGQLLILFTNTSTQVFGGKEYAFQNGLEHIKYNVKVKS